MSYGAIVFFKTINGFERRNLQHTSGLDWTGMDGPVNAKSTVQAHPRDDAILKIFHECKFCPKKIARNE